MFQHCNYFDPFDPMAYCYNPLPEHPTDKQIEEYQRKAKKMLLNGFLTFLAVILVILAASLFSGCVTKKSVSSSLTDHRVTDMMQRMDSVLNARTVVQQDSVWRQEILRQFQSIREKSDTSHTVVVDTAGRIIKETLVINNVRETTSETDRQEVIQMSHRLEVMDSTLSVMREQIEHSDSLLQQKQKTVVKTVKTSFSWWQNIQLWLGRMAMLAIAVLAAIWILKKKLPWIPFGK